jgi:hypothetical protein
MRVVSLSINAIIVDPEIQSRAKLDEALAQEYAEEIKVGKPFPPVIVFSDSARYWLADGFHRYRAHVLAGHQSIRTVIKNGTRRDAILFSVGCNTTHGLRRTNEDKRRAVTMLLIDKEWGNWSNNRIAEACGVSHTFVSQVRAEMTSNGFKFDVRRETANGNIMDTSQIGKTLELKSKFRFVAEQIEEQSLEIDKVVDCSLFDPDKADELNEEIAKIREEINTMLKVLKSKRTELSTLEAKRQSMHLVTVQ